MGNGFFNGLVPGQTAQCYIHGHYEGSRHYARYMIPDGYARYQSTNQWDNPLELVACNQGWMIRDDYQLFTFIPVGCLHNPDVFYKVPESRRRELKLLIDMATERGDH